MRERPSAVLVMAITASAWVWSTYWYGRMACRIASTEGVGAEARPLCVSNSFIICGSDNFLSFASLSKRSMWMGEKPSASMCSKSQPLPFTYSRVSSSPRRFFSAILTEVLPPPCRTSVWSRPEKMNLEDDPHAGMSAGVHGHAGIVVQIGLHLAVAEVDIGGFLHDLEFDPRPGFPEILSVHGRNDVRSIEKIAADADQAVVREEAKLAAEPERQHVFIADRGVIELATEAGLEIG